MIAYKRVEERLRCFKRRNRVFARPDDGFGPIQANLFEQRIPSGVCNIKRGINAPICDLISPHQTLITFITSSPKWLITFTAIRPLVGRGKGRDTSAFSDDHASSSISAFSVVFSAL